ncbi:sigma-70 family RNA polymerase sigma factor [Arthrobacter crystallopoietes BAB-32]|uniref:Sigma-70 family RNA polymerase sigma factor n=1 Tax=Arthrobacter crystallopoietes BAB-32 TaxID=1246476 RepID=N1UYG0_9MICC|nr:RNA polymerase sigma factor [Arthrobacter crystallopoietes]EMY32799.1 sigma-70 family RNA polymerase sigma factor [Arthrobacter crystallopoietes BAB-32]
MPEALPDDVVTAAQSGDAGAFSRIYAALAPGVHGYLKVRGLEDHEGAAQEVFLTVFSRIGTVHGGFQGLRTFTFSVAHARYVDDVRRRARSPHLAGYDPDTDVRAVDSAETTVLESLGSTGIGQQLRQLKPDQQEVLLLRVVADLSLEQVAEIMGRSTGSIKQLQRRALLKLKSIVEREEALV